MTRRSPADTQPGRRVLIIGLDGGTWSVLDRFMELGRMPRLAELCASGYRSELISTVPPITPVAWTGFATGMNPGKHGVFGFLSPQSDPGSYFPPPVRRESIRAPTLWRRLSDAGLRSIVLSVPLTYPPETIDGFVVGGMFTPESAGDSTHPPSLAGELEALGIMPRFRLSSKLNAGRVRRRPRRRARSGGEPTGDAYVCGDVDENTQDYFAGLDDMTERLRRTALHLSQRPWDLMVAVFMSTDRLQHVMWNEVVGCDPDSPLGRRIGEFYGRVDGAIGDLVNAAGDDAVTMLMSDHGFGPCAGSCSMSRWLVDQGFAFHRPKRFYAAARRAVEAAGMKQAAARLIGRRRGVAKAVRRSFIPLDWSRTRAFFQSGTYGIRVNLKGRESAGIVQPGSEYEELRSELMERVLEMRDPATNARIVTEAWRAEDVYEGDETRWAPDVLMRPNPEFGYHLVPGSPNDPLLVRADPRTRGSHRQEGILVLAGRGVRSGTGASGHAIEDIAPTALTLLGLSVPDSVDGQALTELFTFTPQPHKTRRGGGGPGGDESGGYSEEERAEVMRRLSDLGYVD